MRYLARVVLTAAASALILCGVGQARASIGVVYDDGPVAPPYWADCIDAPDGIQVSDSFILNYSTTLHAAVDVGISVLKGDTPTSVSWEIGTQPFESDISFGTATLEATTLKATYLETTPDGIFDIYDTSFRLSGAVQAGTTYYLTLFGGEVAVNTGDIWWNTSLVGQSTGEWWDGTGTDSDDYSGASGPAAFRLVGSVPEPTTIIIWSLLGAVGITLGFRRRKRAA